MLKLISSILFSSVFLLMSCASIDKRTPATSLQNFNDQVEGKIFCRSVETDGMFGQPAGTREHCVEFKNGVLTDDANTFFGNPPERSSFLVSYKGEILVGPNLNPKYVIKDAQTISVITGEYDLKLKTRENRVEPQTSNIQNYNDLVEGKTFCRTVESNGAFGQPTGKRSHCVSFKNAFMTDNANTFFGNPPEREAFFVSYKKEVVIGNKLEKRYILKDQKTLVHTSGNYELKAK